MSGFKHKIAQVRPGEGVESGVVNRATRALQDNVEYLLARIEDVELGSKLMLYGATVNPDVVVGTPVYYSPATSRYEPALAAVEVDATTGLLSVSRSTRVVGVVSVKHAANIADLVLLGSTALSLDSALETGEAVSAGLYYLSRTQAGKLTKAKPPIAVPILQTDGNGNVVVSPQWEDVLNAHTHYHVSLKPQPAGRHVDPGEGNTHTITSPDYDVEGWIAADDALFDGKAPSGAKFGYNIKANPVLRAVWPPLPTTSAVLMLDGVMMPTGVSGYVIMDENGIWWMTDCYGDVPFPDEITTSSETFSGSSESADLDPCYNYKMTLDLYFTRFGFLTDQVVVTGLHSDDDRLQVYCKGDPTKPQSVGNLAIGLDLSLTVNSDADTGVLAMKTLQADGRIRRGPVVGGLYAASGNVILTSDHTQTRDDREYFYGDVGVDFNAGTDRELSPSLIRLDGVLETYVDSVMVLAFPEGETTQFRSRVHIPTVLDLTSPRLKLRFRLLGLGAGTLPALTLTYRIVPAPTALDTPTALPTSDTAGTIDTTITVGTKEYVDVESDYIEVSPGDDVLFTLQRDDGDAYAYQVGVMRQVALVSSGA